MMIVYSLILYAQKLLLHLPGSGLDACSAGEQEELWVFGWHFQSLTAQVFHGDVWFGFT